MGEYGALFPSVVAKPVRHTILFHAEGCAQSQRHQRCELLLPFMTKSRHSSPEQTKFTLRIVDQSSFKKVG